MPQTARSEPPQTLADRVVDLERNLAVHLAEDIAEHGRTDDRYEGLTAAVRGLNLKVEELNDRTRDRLVVISTEMSAGFKAIGDSVNNRFLAIAGALILSMIGVIVTLAVRLK